MTVKFRSHCDNDWLQVIGGVEALGGVNTLIIKNCAGFSDVGALGKLHTLKLIHYAHVVDVNALGQVHTITVRGGDTFPLQ